MALKKSDLYRSLWQSCDELRGGMDASQYKDYILTLLFVKYVTDKARSDPRSLIPVPDGGSFEDLEKLRGKKEIGDGINKIVAKLAAANNLHNVIDLADFSDEEKLGKGKAMQDRLSKLVGIFADLDFRRSRAEGDDLLGDAYEYLMRHFATESGKSKGQFYTPAEVSRVIAKIVGVGLHTSQDRTVYDPTCGSGSLLIKVADEAPRGLSLYGQEKDVSTYALAQMNMILHGMPDAELFKGDTMTDPQLTESDMLRTFDFAVANPPFSYKSWSNGLESEYGRFEYGRPPEKNGDYAFLLHILKSLKGKGKAAVILPHGVLFRGGAEGRIRRELVRRGFIKGIVGLPSNLFYGTGIPACIVVLDKENAAGRAGVFMVDASRGFIKDGAKNRLRSQDIHKIVDVFNRQVEVDRYSRMVPLTEIASEANKYNLNLPRYIDSSEPEDVQDLRAHLHGGIPDRDIEALNAYWDAFPSLRGALFKPRGDGYSDPVVDSSEIQETILGSPRFEGFAADIARKVGEWFESHREALLAIDENTRPTELIETLGDDLLARFGETPLLDRYDVYEQLLTYWHEAMHDDVYLIMHSGWLEASRPREAIADKDRKLNEEPDLVVTLGGKKAKFKSDLVPVDLIVARYLPERKAEIDRLVIEAEQASLAAEEFVAAAAVEEGPLWGAVEDGKVTKGLITARMKEARREDAAEEEVAALKQAITLLDIEANAKRALREGRLEFDRAALEQYAELSEEDVKSLVLECKWAATVTRRVEGVLATLTNRLVERIDELVDRYGVTLPQLEGEAEELSRRVADHLAELGAR
ncbi:MAG TPA: class I SAM-dependent DNA methyltransferase [Solirubrobacterales bacterium]|nr:class I SAM-dependent DNA methyltransferase [Solirubrobacterales bacterium]